MKSENKHYTVKTDATDITLSTSDAIKVINIEFAQQSQRKIDVFSKYLDSKIFDNAEYISAIKQLSISSHFTKIRFLIKDSEPMVKNGHRIIEIIQQLTSSVEVRQIPKEYESYNEAFSLFDEKGIIFQNDANRYEGMANFNRPRLASELTTFFNQVWERSSNDANLRRVYL